ncbi:MAG: hypothetical protein C0397_19540 [Odoribacter sp.]|nr:hypothetical protein [Odoribacter sp.]
MKSFNRKAIISTYLFYAESLKEFDNNRKRFCTHDSTLSGLLFCIAPSFPRISSAAIVIQPVPGFE